MTSFGREAVEVEALRTDRYLEALLAQRDGLPRPAATEPTVAGSPRGTSSGALAARPESRPQPLDPAIRTTIDRLGRDLVRVHPSFRFEERLARQLAEVAAAMRLPAAAGAEGAAVPVPFPFGPGLHPGLDPDHPLAAGSSPGRAAVPRPLLIGAASAAISIAGAAIVAWRLGRPPFDPMTRAVRAAHQLRGAGQSTARPSSPRLD